MIARRAAFVLSRVELAYDASFTVLRVPDQSLLLAEKTSAPLTPEL